MNDISCICFHHCLLWAGNKVTGRNNPALEANPLKIMAGGPYTTTYNNK